MKKHQVFGFTLIELTIVMVVIAILGVGAVELLKSAALSQIAIAKVNQTQWDGQLAIARITDDLQSIQSPNSITTAASTTLSFTNMDGQVITYQLSGNNLLRNNKLLASNITSLAFGYYDSDGATTATIANIRYITVNFTIANFTSYDFTTGVYLWAAT